MSAPKGRKAQPRHVLAARVAELHAQGLAGTAIARELRISKTYAYELVTDPTGDAARARKKPYHGTCEECGTRTSYTVGGPSLRCRECATDERTVWTREAILCAIQEWADDHGGIPPCANDWRGPNGKRGPWPSVNHVKGRCGSWNQALIDAGYEPHPSGPVGGYTPLTLQQRRECARRYAAGQSATSIAADLGCGPNIVLKWARRAGVPIRPSFVTARAA